MVSPTDRLNYIFHYRAVPEMEGFNNYESRADFVTNIHSNSFRDSLDKYSERKPNSDVLDNVSAAIVYDIDFGGQSMNVRLEYRQDEDVIGVSMDNNGKCEEFVDQLSNALEEEDSQNNIEVKTKEQIAPQH